MNKSIITISKKAMEQFTLLAKKNNYPYVKIAIVNGGLHGFNYSISYVNNKKNCIPIQTNIILCNKSSYFLSEMSIDYDYNFIFKNPNEINKSEIDKSFNCFHNY